MNLGFFSLLSLMLAAAKLLGLFSYSWWMVFAPMLISLSVTLFLLALTLAAAVALAIAVDKVK